MSAQQVLDRHAPKHLRINLAHRSEARTAASAHSRLFSRNLSGLLLIGEERGEDRMQEAAKSLAASAGGWSPLLFGSKAEYILGYAAAGGVFQLWAAEKAWGAPVPVSERLNMATLGGRLAVVKAAVKALSYLRCAARALAHQPRLLPLGIPEVFAHADGGWQEESVVSADMSVCKTIRPWSLFVWSHGGPEAAADISFGAAAAAYALAAQHPGGLPGLVRVVEAPRLVAAAATSDFGAYGWIDFTRSDHLTRTPSMCSVAPTSHSLFTYPRPRTTQQTTPPTCGSARTSSASAPAPRASAAAPCRGPAGPRARRRSGGRCTGCCTASRASTR